MTIGMGVVFVLLLGEIDLSVGFVSGVAGVMTALLLLDDGNQIGAVPAIIIAVAGRARRSARCTACSSRRSASRRSS